jgi:hypothetical protein
MVNQILDYQDKTERLEAALESANKRLTDRGVSPENVPDEEDSEGEVAEGPVQLVVNVGDPQRTLTAEIRVIFLWHYATQLLVRYPYKFLHHQVSGGARSCQDESLCVAMAGFRN